MRTKFLNLIFLFAIVGCKQPAINKVQQAVEAQAKLFVDSGLIVNEYVILYELAINDSNHIYRIQAADCPADLKFEYPSKILKYKDKYLCYIELDELPMSADEMIDISGYSGNLVEEGGGGESWILVVSKLGKKKILIDISLLEGWGTYFNITELWPYFSGYVKGCPVQMGIMSHDVELNDFYLSCNIDSIKRNLFWNENQRATMIKNVYGQIYLKNNTDSVVCLSSSTKRHYAVVNGQDSLYLSLCDSLPIILGPNEKRILEYKSLPRQDVFFRNLALIEDSWGDFYKLFCRSTYSLISVNGRDYQTKVMFHDIDNYGFDVSAMPGFLFRILNHGIYDKKDGEMSRFRFWSDKWNAMSDADRKRLSEDADKRYQRNVNRIRYGSR